MRGFQVAPAELEGHLLNHPYVADCAVVGIPNNFSGEVPMAFVTLSEEAKKLADSGNEHVDRIKATIKKVRSVACRMFSTLLMSKNSTFLIPRFDTSG